MPHPRTAQKAEWMSCTNGTRTSRRKSRSCKGMLPSTCLSLTSTLFPKSLLSVKRNQCLTRASLQKELWTRKCLISQYTKSCTWVGIAHMGCCLKILRLESTNEMTSWTHARILLRIWILFEVPCQGLKRKDQEGFLHLGLKVNVVLLKVRLTDPRHLR